MQKKTCRILLTGSNGQIGRELRRTLLPLGIVTALDHANLDLTDQDALRKVIRELRPSLIVNAAAYTAVDRAESEPDLAMAVNGFAPGIMAEEARKLNAVLVHYSTDYVFDGTKPTAYIETDIPNPLSVYGKTKLVGEQAIHAVDAAHYILRTSWIYASEGSNFVNTILRLAQENSELRIVNDQTGAPTWARAIAEMTAQMLALNMGNATHPCYGLYHLTATGSVTWFGFAQEILEAARKTKGFTAPKLIPITTSEYPLPARRPVNSQLDTSLWTKIFGITPASWQKMLEQYTRENRSATNLQ
jgi:dTDP-4-dehydrorhamnose reductase